MVDWARQSIESPVEAWQMVSSWCSSWTQCTHRSYPLGAAEEVRVWWSEEKQVEGIDSEGSDKCDDDVILEDMKQEQDDSTEAMLRQHWTGK